MSTLRTYPTYSYSSNGEPTRAEKKKKKNQPRKRRRKRKRRRRRRRRRKRERTERTKRKETRREKEKKNSRVEGKRKATKRKRVSEVMSECQSRFVPHRRRFWRFSDRFCTQLQRGRIRPKSWRQKCKKSKCYSAVSRLSVLRSV
jgi:hypothetical protein